MLILGSRLEGGVGGSLVTHVNKDQCFVALKAYYAAQQEKRSKDES
jgi:hypothetical protein